MAPLREWQACDDKHTTLKSPHERGERTVDHGKGRNLNGDSSGLDKGENTASLRSKLTD